MTHTLIYRPYVLHDSLIHVKKKSISKYPILYKKSPFLIQSPVLYIPFGSSHYNNKSYISCSLDIASDFKSYIESIESYFKSKVFFKHMVFKSNIKTSVSYPPTFRLTYTNTLAIYTKEKVKISNSLIPPKSRAKCIIQCSYIWIHNNTYGIHWSLIQILLYMDEPFSSNEFLFIDSDEETPEEKNKEHNNPIYDTYKRMLTLGLPKEAVIHKMTRDNIDIKPLFPNEEPLSKSISKNSIIKSKLNRIVRKKPKAAHQRLSKLIPSQHDLKLAIQKLKKI